MGKSKTIAEIEKSMTPKQIKLARALAAGGISKGEAYRQVYGWKGESKPAMYVEATRTAANPKVSLLATAIRERETARLWKDKGKFQDWLMDGITSTIENTESDITRLKALELAGRTRYASIFEEPQANESTTQLHDNISELIQSKLAMLLTLGDVTSTKCIDITPGNAELHDVTKSDRGGLTLEGVSTTPTGGGEGDKAG